MCYVCRHIHIHCLSLSHTHTQEPYHGVGAGDEACSQMPVVTLEIVDDTDLGQFLAKVNCWTP